MNKQPLALTVYSRSYCHLCDDMIAALRALQTGWRYELRIVDVDSDPALEARYGELVPVLTGADGEICHYHLDTQKLEAYLSR